MRAAQHSIPRGETSAERSRQLFGAVVQRHGRATSLSGTLTMEQQRQRVANAALGSGQIHEQTRQQLRRSDQPSACQIREVMPASLLKRFRIADDPHNAQARMMRMESFP